MAKIQHYDIGDLWTPLMTWKVDTNNDGAPERTITRTFDASGYVIRTVVDVGNDGDVTEIGAGHFARRVACCTLFGQATAVG